MGFFSVNKEVFPIGICLRGPIRGTGSDGKLNLLLLLIRFIAVSIIGNLNVSGIASCHKCSISC